MKSHLRFSIIVFAGVFLDLFSKSLVFDWLGYPSHRHYTLLANYLDLRCATNRGGVFGLFQGAGILFIPLSFLALGIVVWFYSTSYRHAPRIVYPLGLVTAGTLGNLYDRVFHGHQLLKGSVRDFIDFHVGQYVWPTFNIADICICVGAGLLVLFLMTEKEGAAKTG